MDINIEDPNLYKGNEENHIIKKIALKINNWFNSLCISDFLVLNFNKSITDKNIKKIIIGASFKRINLKWLLNQTFIQ